HGPVREVDQVSPLDALVEPAGCQHRASESVDESLLPAGQRTDIGVWRFGRSCLFHRHVPASSSSGSRREATRQAPVSAERRNSQPFALSVAREASEACPGLRSGVETAYDPSTPALRSYAQGERT